MNDEQSVNNRPVDCQVFADQLDALVRGELPMVGMRQLRLHGETCPECGMLLQVQEHLLHPSLEALEAQVPEEMVVGMWDAVHAGIREVGEARVSGDPAPSRLRFRARAPWLVPTLAAATLVLLFSTGLLYRQTGALESRADALAQQVEEQRHWMAELGAGAADPVARTAALAGRSPWSRALSRQDEISLSSLRSLLARAPGDRVILSQVQLDAVLRNRLPLSPAVLRDLLTGIPGNDGVTAEELIRALEGLDLSPETMVPTSELVALLS